MSLCHHSCWQKQKLRKGLWSPEEDDKLERHIRKYGHGCWSSVPKLAGLQRCGKSCRLRWVNYLRPDLKRGMLSPVEEKLIIKLHSILGNRWSQIASHVTGRTDNEIKNYWNTCIKKKLRQASIDPVLQKQIGKSFGGAREKGSLSSTNSNRQSQLDLSSQQLNAGANRSSISLSDNLKLTSKLLGSSEDATSHAKGRQAFQTQGSCSMAQEYSYGSDIQVRNFLLEASNMTSNNASENECQKYPFPINVANGYERFGILPQSCTISDINPSDAAEAAMSNPYWCFLHANHFPRSSFCDESSETHKLHTLLTDNCKTSEQWSSPNMNCLNWEAEIVEGAGIDFYRNPNADSVSIIKSLPMYQCPSVSNGSSSDQDLSFTENVALMSSSTDTRNGNSSKLFYCGNLASCNAITHTSAKTEDLTSNPSEVNYIDLYTAALLCGTAESTDSPETSSELRQQIRSSGTQLVPNMVHACSDILPSTCAGQEYFDSKFQDLDLPIRVELAGTWLHPESGLDLYDKCKSVATLSPELQCIAAALDQI